eukprot:gene25712-46816_t
MLREGCRVEFRPVNHRHRQTGTSKPDWSYVAAIAVTAARRNRGTLSGSGERAEYQGHQGDIENPRGDEQHCPVRGRALQTRLSKSCATGCPGMALFFDAPWFDEKLAQRGLGRAALAAVAGLGEAELALVFKDQMELSAGQVAAFAELLGVSSAEIAGRAGVATPGFSKERLLEDRMADLEARTAALEAEIARLERVAGGKPVPTFPQPALAVDGRRVTSQSSPTTPGIKRRHTNDDVHEQKRGVDP